MSPAVEERFGPYGGRFVPETLIAALDELSAAWAAASEDDGFQSELAGLLRDFVGRPTPLYLAERLSERVGGRVYLKREDLAHTGAHKINNAVGQALLARRMGKTRVIAETGAGQHGVATATACALFGLECAVYMGTEDIRRQAPNVERMNLLGAEVIPVEAGARTLKEAVSAAIRDWVASVETTHYVIGSVVGPAPYPALVRDLQRVIGDEARAQALEAEGSLPQRVIACVGGGSNAIGSFHAFLDDPVELIGVEAGGEGLESGHHGASLVAGGKGVLHGAFSAVLEDEQGQILEAHSVSAGLDYPGVGPEHAHLRDSGRATYVTANDAEALLAFRELARLEGIIPALEPATRSPGCSKTAVAMATTYSPSPAGATRTWTRSPRSSLPSMADGTATETGAARIEAAFAAAREDGRAALMPYLMGGFPDQETATAVAGAYADAGADLIELGVPFSDPLADGPTIHAADTAALAAGATLESVLETCAEVGERIPVALMVYANMVLAAGPAEFAERAAAAKASGVIVPDLPLEEQGPIREALGRMGSR